MKERKRIVKDLVKDEYFHRWIIAPDEDCIEFWQKWEMENAERKSFIDEAKNILLSTQFKIDNLPNDKKDLIWDSITCRIERETASAKRKNRNHLRYMWYGIAASLILVVTVIFSYDSFFSGSAPLVQTEAKLIEKKAPIGKISSYRLGDGTMVRLFSGSTITFDEDYGVNVREVYLEGEGFFDVVKDKSKPFIVKTKGLSTTAIGTSFNVRTYKNTMRCEVSLVTGKVKVESLEKSIETLNEVILIPGEEALLNKEGVIKQPFNIDEKTAWKDGYIYLEDKSFDESLQILQRWFNVDFVVNHGYKSTGKKGSGKFKNQSLNNILNSIGYSFDFTHSQNEDKVTINFN